MEGFKAQYLNLWPPADEMPSAREFAAIPAEAWAPRCSSVPTGYARRPVASRRTTGTAPSSAWPGRWANRVRGVVVPVASVAAGVEVLRRVRYPVGRDRQDA